MANGSSEGEVGRRRPRGWRKLGSENSLTQGPGIKAEVPDAACLAGEEYQDGENESGQEGR